MRPHALRRSARCLAAVAGGLLVVLGASGCGSSTPQPQVAPADLLINPQQLPAGFTPTQLSVTDLVNGNKDLIEASRTADIAPADCRPTADAEMNAQLSQDNSAVLAARANDAGMVSLVTTVRRDIEADIRATTGACVATTTTVTDGNLRGAQIVSRYTQITHPDLGIRSSSVRRSVLLRSVSTTTYVDGAASSQVGYAGYATVARPAGESVTVQVTVTGDATTAAKPASPPVDPMTPADFTAVFRDAVTAAAAP